MKRPLRPEELHVWTRVAATVRPLSGRPAVDPPRPVQGDKPPREAPREAPLAEAKPRSGFRPEPPAAIEPRRRRRLTLGLDPLGPRLDLHGLGQDEARAALAAFLERAVADGWRAVLVITGKGLRGDGVLRRRVPEWLADPRLRSLIAGISEAHRRHGGEGALYVALKRPAKD